MADNMGSQFIPPQYYWPQMQQGMGPQPQQPWGGQMGTRGVEGQQPLQPGEFQGQMGQQQGFGMPQQQQQQQGFGMPQQQQQQQQVPVNLSPQEKNALRGALEILKEGRVALATEELDPIVAQRLTAAHAYVSGFLEARGIGELGTYIKTIPPVTTRGADLSDPRYDQMVDNFEQFLNNGGQTRFPWGLVVSAIPVAVDAAKWAYRRAKR